MIVLQFNFSVIFFSSSISNIIEEHEEQQEKAKNQARAATSNKPATQNKRGDFSGLLGSGTATNDADFSFGGPVADEGGENVFGFSLVTVLDEKTRLIVFFKNSYLVSKLDSQILETQNSKFKPGNVIPNF